jgi:uncharacterized protein (DUF1810 family)
MGHRTLGKTIRYCQMLIFYVLARSKNHIFKNIGKSAFSTSFWTKIQNVEKMKKIFGHA